MTQADLDLVLGAIVPEVKRTIAELLGGVQVSIAALEARAAVPGPPGRDGRDGRDGGAATALPASELPVVLEDLDLAFDGERGIEFVLRRAGVEVKRWAFTLPAVIYRGVWGADGRTSYAAGDCVTRGGSIWIARRLTSAEPVAGHADWTLAVKEGRRGRDGKDAAAVPAPTSAGARW